MLASIKAPTGSGTVWILVFKLAPPYACINEQRRKKHLRRTAVFAQLNDQETKLKRTIINGLIAGLSSSLLVACGGTTDTSSSGSKMLATTTACYAAWVSTTAYNGGATVSYNGVNYTAAYWTQNQNPSTNNGPAGSGQPWISNGACGSTPTPTPTPTPAPTPTPTPAPTPTPTPAGVTLFQDCNYSGGWSASFGTGSYRLTDITARGGRNDDASSIRI